MKIEDFKEIKNKHFKACEKIVAQDGSCDGVNCCDCPFDDSNAINGNTCNINGYQTRSFRDKDFAKKEYSKEFLKFRDEGKMKKEKVLEIEFQDVFDKVAWRIVYQNEHVLKRWEFEDDEIGVASCYYPSYTRNTLMLLGANKQKDNDVCIVTKEEAEIIKQKVYTINEKYGVPKRWRADIGKAYYYIDSCGDIVAKEENGTTTDDKRYEFGNYFKTKKELSDDKIRKIQSIIIGK